MKYIHEFWSNHDYVKDAHIEVPEHIMYSMAIADCYGKWILNVHRKENKHKMQIDFH